MVSTFCQYHPANRTKFKATGKASQFGSASRVREKGGVFVDEAVPFPEPVGFLTNFLLPRHPISPDHFPIFRKKQEEEKICAKGDLLKSPAEKGPVPNRRHFCRFTLAPARSQPESGRRPGPVATPNPRGITS
jgi:hypothetical protein